MFFLARYGIPNNRALVPTTPVITSVTRVNNTTLTIAFTQGSNNGSAITSYTTTSSPSISLTTTGTSSPLTVTGSFAIDQAYTFTIQAVNAVGSSLASNASSSTVVYPSTVPSAPTIGTVTRISDTSVSIPFTAPVSDGGATITSYTVTSSPSISLTVTGGTTSPLTATGSFAPGQNYTFTIRAVNIRGSSPASAASNSVQPKAATAPNKPVITGYSINSKTNVTLTYSGSSNGSAYTSATVVSSPSIPITVNSYSSSDVVITGSFATNQAYTFTLAMTNAIGTSPTSDPSTSITPNGIPVVTGGTLTSNTTYYFRTFNSSGDLVISNGALSVDVMVLGGGGGGGGWVGGGGGSGGLGTYTGIACSSGTYPILVGAGGTGGTYSVLASSGNFSSFGDFGLYYGYGGGSGGFYDVNFGQSQDSDGSTGGGTYLGSAGTAYTQGNPGNGPYYIGPTNYAAGGGGGIGSEGFDAYLGTSGPNGGDGGSGANTWTNVAVGGGGGGASYNYTGGASGGSGGGRGASGVVNNPPTVTPTSGTANRGGGGGGGSSTTSTAGNGGSGVVIVRYLRSAVGG